MSADPAVIKAESGAGADTQSSRPAHPGLPARLLAITRKLRPRRGLAVLTGACFLGALIFAIASLVTGREDRNEVTIDLGGPRIYYSLPEFIADLKPVGGRTRHLRLSIAVQVSERDIGRIERRQTEIMAAIQAHLRDQAQEDLVGKAGAERLRDGLREIINRKIAPTQVGAVLFTQFLLD